jgi:hypothetical protein
MGPLFTPSVLSQWPRPIATLALPSGIGGSNWPSASLDPNSNRRAFGRATMSELLDLRTRILRRISASTPRSVWTAADFLDLATRDAIDKALQRLVATGTLRRIDRGLYDKPDFNSLTKAPNPADPRQVVEAIARRDQIRVLVDGMTAANDLGLTNAVPAKIVVHTDSRLKPVHLGNLEISFRPTAASKLFWAGRPAMRIVQALHWLRDTTADAEEDRYPPSAPATPLARAGWRAAAQGSA